MEKLNFDSKKYRDELAKDLKNIRETPEGKAFAVNFLDREKETEEYKISKKENLKKRTDFMYNKTLNSENPDKVLGGLASLLQTRDREKTQNLIEKASTLIEIKNVMETGWPESDKGFAMTRIDMNGFKKWEEFSLSEVRKVKSPEELLKIIPECSQFGFGVFSNFLKNHEFGTILLDKFNKNSIQKLATNVLRRIKLDHVSLKEFEKDETSEDLIMTISQLSKNNISVELNDFLKKDSDARILVNKFDKRTKEELAEELFLEIQK